MWLTLHRMAFRSISHCFTVALPLLSDARSVEKVLCSLSKCQERQSRVIRDSGLMSAAAPCPHKFTSLSGPAAHQPLWLSNFSEIFHFLHIATTKGLQSASAVVFSADYLRSDQKDTQISRRNHAGEIKEVCKLGWQCDMNVRGWCLEDMKSTQLKCHPCTISEERNVIKAEYH